MTQCGSDQSGFLAISSNIARTQRLSDEQQEKDAQVIPADPPDPLVKQALADFEAKNHEQELAQLARLSGVVHNKKDPFVKDFLTKLTCFGSPPKTKSRLSFERQLP